MIDLRAFFQQFPSLTLFLGLFRTKLPPSRYLIKESGFEIEVSLDTSNLAIAEQLEAISQALSSLSILVGVAVITVFLVGGLAALLVLAFTRSKNNHLE